MTPGPVLRDRFERPLASLRLSVTDRCNLRCACEIFTSIQGESSYAGMPCTFVRMTGCNLRCSYCDTAYAYEEGNDLLLQQIMDRVRKAEIPLVEITGGEPLLQGEVYDLIRFLLKEKYTVLIETNGSMNIGDIDKRAVIVLDIKTPGSGMSDRMDFANLTIIRKNDEVKFVLTDRLDYEWSKRVIYDLSTDKPLPCPPVPGIWNPPA